MRGLRLIGASTIMDATQKGRTTTPAAILACGLNRSSTGFIIPGSGREPATVAHDFWSRLFVSLGLRRARTRKCPTAWSRQCLYWASSSVSH